MLVIGNESDDSGSGSGLLPDDESPPLLLESMTCSAIFLPILLASIWVLMMSCMSFPFAKKVFHLIIVPSRFCINLFYQLINHSGYF